MSLSTVQTFLRRHRVLLFSLLGLILLAVITFFAFRFFSGRSILTPAAEDDEGGDVAVNTVLKGDKEIRGVWIASYENINFPSDEGLDVTTMKAELDDIVKTTHDAGLNTIFFQVIPSSDALFSSSVYPWSAVLCGKQGQAPEGGFDPLAYIINKAHAAGIELHAWLNPFRVGKDLSALSSDNPAVLHPEYVIRYADGLYYYDPGQPAVKDMIVSAVAELVKNYDVDGVHMDDYFYPYPVNGADFDDSASYAAYGDGKEKADWRRENVNGIVKAIYDTVKAADSEKRFGVSPFGIYTNKGTPAPCVGSDTNGLEAYCELYCDAIAWAKGGYVDYLAPQDYWAFNTSAAPFDTVARWWNANLDGTGVDLYIGHALYKIGDFPKNEITTQVEFARSLLCCKGSCFYGYEALKNNQYGIADKLAALYSDPLLYEPIVPSGVVASINYPVGGYRTTNSSQYMLGSSDPSRPLTLNGSPVSRTKDGFFSVYTSLSAGENRYLLKQGDAEVTHAVSYVTTAAAPVTPTMPSFEITDTTPSQEMWITGGATVSFSCTAPAGSSVSVKVGGASAVLAPQYGRKNTANAFVKETYAGTITFGSFADDGEIVDLGTITFTAENGGRKATKSVGLMKEIGKGAPLYAEVKDEYTYLKTAPDSSFYDDYTPTSPGMRDYIVGYEDGYYKLQFGGYVSQEHVKVVEGQMLFKNHVVYAESRVESAEEQVYDKNYTELRFGVLEKVPVDVWVEGREITIVLYDTDPSMQPALTLCDNPLFASSSVRAGASGKTVLYTMMLKDADNYYGFRLAYEDDCVVLRFNNPITLVPGDKPLSGKVIYVDAGHGGDDIGAPGPASAAMKMSESTLNLLIANRLAVLLADEGAEVYTTRTADDTYSLYDRLDMISEVVPDMLISVHQNSVGDTTDASKARGFLGLYSNNAGILLAKTVSDTVTGELNRFQRATAYQMLAMARDHRFPSTLCEMLFISNPEEFQWSLNEDNLDRSAEALRDGILEFFRKQEAYRS